jgi:hypothetical protein
MTDTPIPLFITQSLIKVQRSVEISNDIFQSCLDHIKEENPELLLHIGSLLGDFSNNLRSALNYTTSEIIRRMIYPSLSKREIKKIEFKLDFPWAMKKEELESKKLYKIIQNVSIPLYNKIINYQPFVSGNEWLGDLMILSNTDKHIVINQINAPVLSSMLAIKTDGTEYQIPWFVGDKLVLIEGKEPVALELPVYFELLKAFATQKKTWVLYTIPIYKGFNLDLIHFINTSPPKMIRIIRDLELLIKE